MAQHRTKKEKIAAQIHRMENTQLYSLSKISHDDKPVNQTPVSTLTKKSEPTLGINMQTVKADLTRSAVSLGIVLIVLAIGFYFLH